MRWCSSFEVDRWTRFFFSSRRRHTRCALVTGVQTCALPIYSPRWHDGALWLLESGAGRLLRVDAASGSAEEICALPGYLRGLDFVGPHALIGLCKARETDYFGGLPVQARPRELLCGVALVDTRSGAEDRKSNRLNHSH